jgi:hypothetical protein
MVVVCRQFIQRSQDLFSTLGSLDERFNSSRATVAERSGEAELHRDSVVPTAFRWECWVAVRSLRSHPSGASRREKAFRYNRLSSPGSPSVGTRSLSARTASQHSHLLQPKESGAQPLCEVYQLLGENC